MAYTVPELGYPYEALEPHIDAQTMRIHHDKHHATYVANLNKALEGSEFAAWSPEDIARDWAKLPEALRTPARNNGGGHYNHSLFWKLIGPGGGGRPTGSLAAAIDVDLGDFEAFKAEFAKAALGRFGSGWAWLVLGPDRKLKVTSTPNQDCPLADGLTPLLGIDVWEHAYYLKYQNRRAEYIEAFFNVVQWKEVAARYEHSMK
jgi:superoxide dismutase, Fe-Mn family